MLQRKFTALNNKLINGYPLLSRNFIHLLQHIIRHNTVIKEGSYLKGWSQTKGASHNPIETSMPPVIPSPSPKSPFTVINNGASADVINNGAEQTVTVIIAGYEGDMLRSISTEDITFEENEKRTFTLGSGTYKVFVWNSLSGMVPMAE